MTSTANEEELEALRAIYSGDEEILSDDAGRHSMRLLCSAGAAVVPGEPLAFHFWFNESYPKDGPPSCTLTAPWLTRKGFELIRSRLVSIWEDGSKEPCLYTWIEWHVFLHIASGDKIWCFSLFIFVCLFAINLFRLREHALEHATSRPRASTQLSEAEDEAASYFDADPASPVSCPPIQAGEVLVDRKSTGGRFVVEPIDWYRSLCLNGTIRFFSQVNSKRL